MIIHLGYVMPLFFSFSNATNFKIDPSNNTIINSVKFASEFLSGLASIILYVIFFIFLVMAYFWIRKKDSTTILPFEVSPHLNINSKAIIDLLLSEIIRIVRIHESANDKFDDLYHGKKVGSEPLKLLALPIVSSESTPQFGTISISQASFSISEFILFIKKILGFSNQIITGTLQKIDKNVYITAKLNDGKPFFWSANKIAINSDGEDVVFELIRELAYKIIYDLYKVSTTLDYNCEIFKIRTEIMEKYEKYLSTMNFSYVEGILDLESQSINQYRTNDQLGLFPVFFNIAQTQFSQGLLSRYNDRFHYFKAIEFYLKAIDINPKDKDTNYYLGICNYLLNQLDEAAKYFEAVLKIDKNYRDAENNLKEIRSKLREEEETEKLMSQINNLGKSG